MPLQGRCQSYLLILGLLSLTCTASRNRRSTFQRLQQTVEGTPSGSNPILSVLSPTKSLEKLQFIQNVVKNGFEPHELVSSMVGSPDFKKIYEHPEVVHKILESNPLLHSIAGFREASGRRLSDQETVVSFQEGVKNLLEISKHTTAQANDPSSVMSTMESVSKSDDPEIQALMEEARNGNHESLQKLQGVVAEKTLPGFSFDTMQDVFNKQTFDSILNKPELMHFIDQDKHLSDLFRQGHVLPSKLKQGSTATPQKH